MKASNMSFPDALLPHIKRMQTDAAKLRRRCEALDFKQILPIRYNPENTT